MIPSCVGVGAARLQLVNHGIFPTDQHAPAPGSHCTVILELPLVQHVCWYDVLRYCLGKVVTFLGRHFTESVQFQQVVYFLESRCVEFFLVRFRQLITDQTTLVFRSGCYPRRIVFRYQTQPFLRLPQRSLSFVQSRRRHSRARLPVLSNKTQFQLEALSGSCWQISTITKEVSKMLCQAGCPHGLRLVSGISTSLRG